MSRDGGTADGSLISGCGNDDNAALCGMVKSFF
jgi:hypothetical protein